MQDLTRSDYTEAVKTLQLRRKPPLSNPLLVNAPLPLLHETVVKIGLFGIVSVLILPSLAGRLPFSMTGAPPSPTLRAQDRPPLVPLGEGSRWTYGISGPGEEWKRTVLVLGKRKEVALARIEGKWKGVAIVGFDGREAYFVDSPGELRLVGRPNNTNAAAKPAMEIIAEFRWNGPQEWSFPTKDSCHARTVSCRRGAKESITVRAGSYECTRFTIGDDTYWIAPEVGIVQRKFRGSTWELLSCELKK